ncbi:NUDIX domain-containing protein [Streptomyces sp. NBC_01476]|uniref:NUDIX domain-containing protein n=1 Tax=Streptomyces sp. NBC_01476 TaxID=2903881 RepID=UPI002E3095E3|nr:NUDIX domain-containing protein [Streptomyces sp. NBC_01476]
MTSTPFANERGEAPVAAAARELEEETGVRVLAEGLAVEATYDVVTVNYRPIAASLGPRPAASAAA